MAIPSAPELLATPSEQAIGLLLGVIADLRQLIFETLEPPKASSNTSRPPASDIVPRTPSLRRPSSKKSGGQAGRRGSTRMRTDTSDLVRGRRAAYCSKCGTYLSESPPEAVVEERRVIDLPPIRTVTTAYQGLAVTCSNCHEMAAGRVPPEVTALLGFGPRLLAIATDLREVKHSSYHRPQQTLPGLSGRSNNQASQVNLIAKAADAGRPTSEAIRDEVVAGPAIGSDTHRDALPIQVRSGLQPAGAGSFRDLEFSRMKQPVQQGAAAISSMLQKPQVELIRRAFSGP